MKKNKTKFYLDFNQASVKRVSYILATKNRPKLLEKTLMNVSGLIKKQDELIVIDGGGDKQTQMVAKKYSFLIDIFLSEPDSGQTHAANKGIMLSKGKYIKFLADDDVIYPELMEKAIKILDKNKEIEVMLCGGEVFHKDTKITGISYIPPGRNYGSKAEDVFLYGATGIGLIIRRTAFSKAGLFPTVLISDVEFVVNCILKKMKVKFCRLKLYKAFVYDHSIIMSRTKESTAETYKLLRKHTSFIFYLKYRLNEFIWKRLWLNNLSIYTANFLNLFSPNSIKSKPSEYIWDGGFS